MRNLCDCRDCLEKRGILLIRNRLKYNAIKCKQSLQLFFRKQFCTDKNSTYFLSTVKLHIYGPLLQMAGHPFPLLLGQPSSALLPNAPRQVAHRLSKYVGPPKLLFLRMLEAIKWPHFPHANSLGNLQFWDFFQPMFIGENYLKKLNTRSSHGEHC